MRNNSKHFPFHLIEKISSYTYLAWLKSINKYVVLDYTILNLIKKKPSLNYKDFLNEIINVLDISTVSAEKINDDISDLLLESNLIQPDNKLNNSYPLKDCPIDHFYSFNGIIVKVSYDCIDTRTLIHPKYTHLEIKSVKKFDSHYKVFNTSIKLVIFKNGELVGSWSKNELHEFQGKFSMEFLCSSYNKTEHDWMGVFHASTISKNNSSIMFTGDSGNGKSTLVSILMANDYNIIADDFTPILRTDMKTYCFPTAISIKEKSFDLIESLHPETKDFDQYYINEIKGNVKYLPPATSQTSANCNSVVWVKYGKELDNKLEKISTENALQKFLPDAWISNHEINAKAFMKWVSNTNFYELKYSDNKKLISLVDSLFLD